MTLIFVLAFYGAAIALAAYTLFVELPRSAVLQARNTLFATRTEMFEMARRGEISFSSRAYQLHRHQINGLIRFADDISFTHFLITMLIQRRSSVARGRQMKKALDKAGRKETRKVVAKLEKLEGRAHAEMVLLMVGRSMLATVIFRLAWFGSIVGQLFSDAHSKCTNYIRQRRERPRPITIFDGDVHRIQLRDTRPVQDLQRWFTPSIDGKAWQYAENDALVVP